MCTEVSGASGIVNQSWAGALQIFSWSNDTCDIGHNGTIKATIYAPFADVQLIGGSSNPAFVGSIMAKSVTTASNLAFHYDEALRNSSTVVGIGSQLTTWYDLEDATELAGLAAATGNFLQ